MTDEELLRIVGLAADLGIDRVRLTGGEPTVRPHLVSLVDRIHAIPGIREIALTTNGTLLEKLAEPLKAAGLTRVNISVDTLDPERFARITRLGKAESVWRGLYAAERAGLHPIKLNAVIIRDYNLTDLVELARLTLDHPWEMRFIEVMPIGSIADFQIDSLVPFAEMKARLEAVFGTLEALDWDGHVPARSFRIPGAQGTIGLISSVSEPFCEGCNRVRLTADGKLRLCLLRDTEVDLLTPLRTGVSNDALRERMRASIHAKPWGHALTDSVHPEFRHSSEIGG